MNSSMLSRQIHGNLVSLRYGVIVLLSAGLIWVQYWTTNHASYALYDHEPTFLADVMLFSQFGSGSSLYLFLLPFLAALLGGSTYAQERYSQRLSMVLVRSDQGAVLRTSMASGFILGGIGGVTPLVLNMMVMGLANPHMSFIEGTEWDSTGRFLNRYTLVSSWSWIYPLYLRNQWLCIVVILLLVFLLGGLFGTLAVTSSFFINHRHVELLVPFGISLLWWMVPGKPDQWSHIIFMFFSPPTIPELRAQNIVGLVLSVAGLTAMSTVLYLLREHHDAA